MTSSPPPSRAIAVTAPPCALGDRPDDSQAEAVAVVVALTAGAA